MAQQTEAVYYTELHGEDVMISALGTANTVGIEDAEFWGRLISWESITGGSVDSIRISYNDGATWREATVSEVKLLEYEAQTQIDEECFQEVYHEF